MVMDSKPAKKNSFFDNNKVKNSNYNLSNPYKSQTSSNLNTNYNTNMAKSNILKSNYESNYSSNYLTHSLNTFINNKYQEVELDKTYLYPKGSFNDESTKYMNNKERILFYFASGSNIAGLRFLTINEAHINTLDEERTSPLHIACRSGSLQMVEEIINQGAMIDIPDLAGWTSLHIACYFKRSECILLLVKNHANLLTRNRDGECPFDLVHDDISCIEVIGNFVKENPTFDTYLNERIENLIEDNDYDSNFITEDFNTNKYDKNIIDNLYKIYLKKKKEKDDYNNQNSNSKTPTKVESKDDDDDSKFKKEVYNVLDLKQKMSDLYKIIPKKHTFYLEYNKSKKEEINLLNQLKENKNKNNKNNNNSNNSLLRSISLKNNESKNDKSIDKIEDNRLNTDRFHVDSKMNKDNSDLVNYDAEELSPKKDKSKEVIRVEKKDGQIFRKDNTKVTIKLTQTRIGEKFGGINSRKELQLKGFVSKNLQNVKNNVLLIGKSSNNTPTILKDTNVYNQLREEEKLAKTKSSNNIHPDKDLYLKKKITEKSAFSSSNYMTENNNSSSFIVKSNGVKIPLAFPDTKNLKSSYSNSININDNYNTELTPSVNVSNLLSKSTNDIKIQHIYNHNLGTNDDKSSQPKPTFKNNMIRSSSYSIIKKVDKTNTNIEKNNKTDTNLDRTLSSGNISNLNKKNNKLGENYANNVFIQEILQEIKIKPSQSQTIFRSSKNKDKNNNKNNVSKGTIKKVLPDGPIFLEESQIETEILMREKKTSMKQFKIKNISTLSPTHFNDGNKHKESKILQNMLKHDNKIKLPPKQSKDKNKSNNINSYYNTRNKTYYNENNNSTSIIKTNNTANSNTFDYKEEHFENKNNNNNLLKISKEGYISSSSNSEEIKNTSRKTSIAENIFNNNIEKEKDSSTYNIINRSSDIIEHSAKKDGNSSEDVTKIDDLDKKHKETDNSNNKFKANAFSHINFMKNTRNYKLNEKAHYQNESNDFSFFIDYENELNRIHKLKNNDPTNLRDNYQNQSFYVSCGKDEKFNSNLFNKNENKKNNMISLNTTLMGDDAESFLLDEYAFNPQTYNIKEIIDLTFVSHEKIFILNETDYFLSNISLKEIFINVFKINTYKLEKFLLELFSNDPDLGLILLLSIHEVENTISGLIKSLRNLKNEKLVSQILFSNFSKELVNFEKIGLNLVLKKYQENTFESISTLETNRNDLSSYNYNKEILVKQNKDKFINRMFIVHPNLLSKKAILYNYFNSFSYETINFNNILKKVLKGIELDCSKEDILIKIDIISECLSYSLFHLSKSSNEVSYFESETILHQFLFAVLVIDLEVQLNCRGKQYKFNFIKKISDKINKLFLDFMVIIKDINNGKNLDSNKVKEFLKQIQLTGFLKLNKNFQNDNSLIAYSNLTSLNFSQTLGNKSSNQKKLYSVFLIPVILNTNGKDNRYFTYISNSFILLFRIKKTICENSQRLKEVVSILKQIEYSFTSLNDHFLIENLDIDKFLFYNKLFYSINSDSSSSISLNSRMNKRNLLLFKNKKTFLKYTKNLTLEFKFDSITKKNSFVSRLKAQDI